MSNCFFLLIVLSGSLIPSFSFLEFNKFSKENIKQVEWAIEELKAGLVVGQQYYKQELFTLFEIFIYSSKVSLLLLLLNLGPPVTKIESLIFF